MESGQPRSDEMQKVQASKPTPRIDRIEKSVRSILLDKRKAILT